MRDLDVQCARAMGLLVKQSGYYDGYNYRQSIEHWTPGSQVSEGWVILSIPHFSTDHAAARLLEDEIERKGRKGAYILSLCRVLGILPSNIACDAECLQSENDEPGITPDGLWALIHATPEQRARAFLAALDNSA